MLGSFQQDEVSSPYGLSEEAFSALLDFDYLLHYPAPSPTQEWYNQQPVTPTFWEMSPQASMTPPSRRKAVVRTKSCSFSLLPDELILAIFAFLDVRELALVGLVCKSFLGLSRDDQVWKHQCCWRWGMGILRLAQSDKRHTRRKLDWRSVYRNRLCVEDNWRRGKCQVSTIPYSSEITCIQLDDTRIATGSYDTSVKVWNLLDPDLQVQPLPSSEVKDKVVKPLRSLDGHSHRVYCLQLQGNRLLSGSDDTTMKLWDVDKEECLQTFSGHSRPIRCLQFNEDNVLVSGSYDKTVRVWDMERHNTVLTLDRFDWCICCMKFDDKVIVTGSFNKIEMWDRNSGKIIGELEGHKNWITSLQFDDTKLISGSMDSTIKIWDMRTRKCLNTLAEHQKRVRCIQFDNLKLCSGSYDHSVKIWDWRTGTCWVTLYGHTASARCLHYNDTHLVTGSLDKSIKIWDFSQTEVF